MALQWLVKTGGLLFRRRHAAIASLALLGIAAHLVLRFGARVEEPWSQAPLWGVLIAGGVPLVLELTIKLLRREFGSDLLAGLSIVTAVLLEEHLAGSLVVLMLSGGETLESFAVRSASSVLEALSRRMPSAAHRREGSRLIDIDLSDIAVGDTLVVYPHEVAPVDGTVLDGHGSMDESYLTGEPYVMSKTPGSQVISGAANGESALTIRADKLPIDSRYAKIMEVMRESEQHRPRLRRLGDQLGAFYTPVAVAIAAVAWLASGESVRFLAVLVVATPCPLLIAIPVAVIGAISLAAKRGIIVRNPVVLETIGQCRTAIFDKTGTLTYGKPVLTELIPTDEFDANEVLALAASLERYSKHPLSQAVLQAARRQSLSLDEATSISEAPGQGLQGAVAGREVAITSRKQLLAQQADVESLLPEVVGGLECVILIDGRYAAACRFRDEPRGDGAPFIRHLGPKHQFERLMLVSGDRQSEVQYLAERVGIDEVYASQSPEEKLEIVRAETARQKTVFLGDGINDAPALNAATVGLAFGANSDVTSEAADAVILDSSLERVDELLHISSRMRSIALQSAVGGMLVSIAAMFIAAAGYLPPVAGAIAQEVIDVVVVLNALRMSLPPGRLTDY
ncbi:MAG: heavy metal translocating P-type ATPase [Pirellulaceae bacterium]